ncbi:MAG: carbohydrate ABC transporter permease [Chloroflexota bacterium]
MRKDVGLRLLLIAPAMIYILLVVGYPIVTAVWTSLFVYNLPRNIIRFIGLGNYERAFADPTFYEALKVTLEFTIVSVLLEFVIALALAMMVNSKIKAQGLVRSIILMPMFVAPVVVGIVWRFMYDVQFGLVNWLVSIVGLAPQIWLGSGALALPSIIAVDVWQQVSMVFIILLAGLQVIPIDVLEAATVDGATAWQRFRHVTIPYLAPAIGVALVLRTMFALRAFDIIWVATQGGPGTATQTLSVYMYSVGFSQFDLGYSNTLSIILLGIIVVFSVVYVFASNKGVSN